MKNRRKVLIIIGIIILVLVGLLISFYVFKNKLTKEPGDVDNNEVINNPIDNEEDKEVKIIDENSKSRPFAVMIDNSEEARKVQRGIQDAYLVYEILNYIDGRTRFEALYKDSDVKEIAPIRSARIYHIDYVLENDAIFVHWGFSPQAESAIKSLKINNINGMIYGNTYFWTPNISGINVSHRRFTSIEKLKDGAEKLKYNTETEQPNLLKYSAKEISNASSASSEPANSVSISYGDNNTVTYQYDAENKVYLRYVEGKEHIDHNTEKQITVKNIITYKIKNTTISGDDSSRQELHNIGSGKAYYITNGYATEINWSKECQKCQTKYTYLDGKEVIMNDGNTFINIEPEGESFKIS